eukprot:m.122738 g.122738  ORF g.122738 m.122738 type:complete len:123 (+) comp37797_c0_seq10:876-1244(+)
MTKGAVIIINSKRHLSPAYLYLTILPNYFVHFCVSCLLSPVFETSLEVTFVWRSRLQRVHKMFIKGNAMSRFHCMARSSSEEGEAKSRWQFPPTVLSAESKRSISIALGERWLRGAYGQRSS